MPYPEAIKDIKILFSSFHPVVIMETNEEERAVSIATKAALELNVPLFQWSVSQGVTPLQNEFTEETAQPLALLMKLKERKQRSIFVLKEILPHLQDPKVLRLFKEVAAAFHYSRSTMVLVESSPQLPREIENEAVFYKVRMPQRDDYRKLIQSILSSFPNKAPKVELTKEEADRFLDALSGLTLKQARQVISLCLAEDGSLNKSDIQRIIDRKAQMIRDSGALDFYPVKGTQYELGGFDNLKRFLEKTQMAFTAEARGLGLPLPRGILVVGVPGCGKSLTAKFLAQMWQRPLLKLDAGRMFDKFIGETEKNFRKSVQLAESMAPSILWIDEIEKILNVKSGGSDSDGGLARRVFGAFLTWLQEKKSNVYVIATANNLNDLPPELLRKGRFDEVFFVDLPDRKERKDIFSIHLKLKQQDPGKFNLEELSEATQGFSGAEIEQIVVGALLRSLHQKAELKQADLLEEVRGTRPLSVSRAADIEHLRALAKEQFVPV